MARSIFEVHVSDLHACQRILVSLGGNQGRTIGRAVGLAIWYLGQNIGSRNHNFFKKKKLTLVSDSSYAVGPEDVEIFP